MKQEGPRMTRMGAGFWYRLLDVQPETLKVPLFPYPRRHFSKNLLPWNRLSSAELIHPLFNFCPDLFL